MPETTTTPPPQFTTPRLMRDDCWSEEATLTLISAWGRRYLELNRGNLRQKQWQEVADAVNGAHGQVVKNRRTDVQCKNRIDTLKKRYKNEKEMARASAVHGREFVSQWLFFKQLDCLLDSSSSSSNGAFPINFVSDSQLQLQSQSQSQSPPFALPIRRNHGDSIRMNVIPNPQSQLQSLSPSYALPIRRGNDGNVNISTPILPQKRPLTDVSFKRNYAMVAAAAARKEESEEEEAGAEVEAEAEAEEEEEEEEREGDGIKELARVIEKFGEVYRRVEKEKQKQLIELEKQRMEFAKEMECQRMQMIVEMQVQLEKMKRARRSNSDDTCS